MLRIEEVITIFYLVQIACSNPKNKESTKFKMQNLGFNSTK